MESLSTPVKVRIAPSPTGDWHLGNARTALFNYLFAKQQGGSFYLRIEDTDRTRFVEGAEERLLEILEWLNIKTDNLPNGKPFLRQSENLNQYRKIAEQLVVNGDAYYCFATPSELDEMRAEQTANKLPPRYDSRWGYRDLPLAEAKQRVDSGDSYVIRQKMPQDKSEISFDDLVHGVIRVDPRLIDDHVLLKADGYPTYHLAHVVDDHFMGITHVIRGDEWIASTPRHIVLQGYLGYQRPIYAHVPIILGPDKGKLSKRHGAKPVIEYRQDGYLPEALLNFLLLLGWSSGTEEEFFTLEQMIKAFDLKRIHPSPAIFDKDRLDWFNGQYIRRLSDGKLAELLSEYWQKIDPEFAAIISQDPQKYSQVVIALRERLTNLHEFADLTRFFWFTPDEYDQKLLSTKKQTAKETLTALTLARTALSVHGLADWNEERLNSVLRQTADAHNLRAGDILWPIRVALTGLAASPGAFEVLVILGKDESLERINRAIARFKS